MALLFDMNFKGPTDSMVFRHLNGQPFTEEEQAIARGATIEEHQAAGAHVHNPEVEAEADAAALKLAELLFKYVIPHRKVLVPFMTHEDMLEYGRLETIVIVGADAKERSRKKVPDKEIDGRWSGILPATGRIPLPGRSAALSVTEPCRL
ncbi:hypothetical protein [Streptomyces sp. NPDC088270]|uniref:hypothetical protein n=1 Tax=unclassified Streptomyces TaxID=2593676 RepID=UPI003413966C